MFSENICAFSNVYKDRIR